MAQPAFLEIYVAFTVLVLWVVWLRRRAPSPGLDRALARVPWAVGAAVIVGQVLAIVSLTMSVAEESRTATALLAVGRWGSAVAVLAGLAIAAGASVLRLRRRG